MSYDFYIEGDTDSEMLPISDDDDDEGAFEGDEDLLYLATDQQEEEIDFSDSDNIGDGEDSYYFDAEDGEEFYLEDSEMDEDERYWNEEVHSDSTVTRAQSLLMYILFTLTHRLTKVASADLLELINLHIPNLFPRSNYFIEKFFSVADHMDTIEKHFVCEQCQGYMGKEIIQTCVYCGWENRESETTANFFLVLPLHSQIENYLKVNGLPQQNRTPDGVLTCVADGAVYKELRENGTIGEDDLSFQWNCDGMPVFKSSGYSVWPIQLMLNECSPSERKKNVILAALWFGHGKPRMDSFLTPFVDMCNNLSKEGVTWIDTIGQKHCTKIHTLICTSDAVARPALRNAKQFNGQFGCDWCLHPGEVVGKGDGHVRAYPSDAHPERTHASVLEDGLLACTSSRAVNGIKGLSPLCLLSVFNMVAGFVPDYLHNVCQGVTRQFTSLWLDTHNKGKPFYIGRQWEELDRKLLKLKPPFEITRRPRSLSTRRFWKASEWRAFLIFYSLIILRGTLPQQYVNHFFLLVFAIYTLLQSSVTLNEVDCAERALRKFVHQVGELYGTEHMSFNVHQLLHVAQSVRNWGPIWGTSTFPFEGNGGHLLTMFKGTQHVSTQICKSLILFQEAKRLSLFHLCNASDSVKFFCDKLQECEHVSSECGCKTPYIVGKKLEKTNELLFIDTDTGASSFFITTVKETQARVVIDIEDFYSKCLLLARLLMSLRALRSKEKFEDAVFTDETKVEMSANGLLHLRKGSPHQRDQNQNIHTRHEPTLPVDMNRLCLKS
ncbi:uncharacterized protein LOC134261548 [Saccostrea cucullata]|uniref:uncharacterized protein LOC134261548 n=1 Tax=Saccostrea cuccullata TaxID=36930 RepID=UPI002ED33F4D